MEVKIAQSWKERLSGEFQKPYFEQLTAFVKVEYAAGAVYPKAKQIFSAFDYCAFDDTRVVILGQDPYHGEGQANGLCFSVNEDIKPPPSLVN
ncbi:MAG: uracil-DNA glycosylase, partial [Cyclobacteriaceae bacterium]|nr:uracil-DNA glycosylase [Cyclobacteriaceae bacterium]